MLPGPKRDRISLADVLSSCRASLAGSENRLGLPAASGAVVLLADGLGAAALRARAGHARTLASRLDVTSIIDSGFPSTTASAIARMTTGVAPGQNGMVGYSVYDAAGDRIVNQLGGWGAGLDPETWQLAQTIFQAATADGVYAASIGPERYRETGFTHAVLRGSHYLSAETIGDRIERTLDVLHEPGSKKLIYLYVPELDKIGHSKGWESTQWTTQLEAIDRAVTNLSDRLGPDNGLLVTADHGVVDIPSHSHILIDSSAELIDGIRFVAGEPRCLQLHFEKDASASQRGRVIDAWRDSESERSWVVTREEAIAADWFGDVRPEVVSRIGDILIAARKNIAYYDTRFSTHRSRAMIGQHGSWSPAELQVPLLRYGAFA